MQSCSSKYTKSAMWLIECVFHQILSSKTAKSCTNISKHSNNTSGQYSMYVPSAIHMYVSINLYPKYACKQLLYI